ncbi:MAG: hypothetical protein HDT33_06960 [Clostridiales bacterium]|nr:hypothetical protein [Clostridiales bacterium]
MKHKLLRRLGALALAVVLALSMAVTPAWAADTDGLSLNVNTLSLTVGDQYSDFAVSLSLDGETTAVRKSDVHWVGVPANVIKVSGSGTVTALTAGEATITATYTKDGTSFTATCTVSVRQAVERIMLRPDPGPEGFKLNVGERQTLIPLLEPAGVTANLTWETDNPAVATVKEENGNGVVTAVGAGTAVITVKAGNDITAECKITVETPAVTGISLPQTTTYVAVGESEKLTATLMPAGATAKLTWTSSNPRCVTVDDDGVVTGVSAGTATITARADNGVSKTCTVTAQVKTSATSVTLAPTELKLNTGSDNKAQLKATVFPTNSTDKVVWTSSNPNVATVDENGLVTAVGEGEAKITAMAGNQVAPQQCTVTVGPVPYGFKFINATGSGTIQNLQLTDTKVGGTNAVRVNPEPGNAVFTYASVAWSVVNPDTNAPDQSVVRVEKYSETQNSTGRYDASGRSALVTVVGPGQAKLVVTSGTAKGECIVEIPGIVLQGNTMTIQNGKLTMKEGDTETLRIQRFGGAVNAGGNIIWVSSDSGVVVVDNGRLTARNPGTAKITVSLGSYEAEVTVTVQEDTSALIQAGSVTAGGSINLSTVASQLNSIALSKTGSALSYISNLSVATSQGILHDTHRSEADTGAGVGASDRYYLSANTALGQSPLSDLSFVAKNTFSGTADIRYTGVTTDNRSFTGTIRVTVGAASDVFYTAVVDQPLSFQADDFNRICQSKQGGRSLNYITFTLPQASWGQLYYDYNGPSHPGQAVTSGTQYYRTRTPSLDRVSFVPSSTCPSSVAIAYRGMDANGGTYSGVVTISVTKQNGGDSSSDVHFSGLRGERVAFNASSFNLACYNTIGEQLSYVRFGSLPASSEGTLYVNYWAAGSYGGIASANTSYYVSGTPGLNTLSFVSSSTASSQVAIPYTGYGTKGTVYTGTVYIDLDEADQTGLRYSVTSGKTVSFNVNDFNNACVNATGASLNYVRFSTAPTTTQGYLRYRYITGSSYGTVSTSTQCYRVNPNSGSSTPLIGNVYFQANTGYVGTVTLPYTGYNTNGVSFTGEVVIQVTPNTITYTGTNANPLQVSASDVSSACSGLMSKPLSYITLNNLPSTTSGRLYVGYTKLGTGSAANTGTKYYVSGSPNISQLSFVPRGRYTGQVEVGYTAVSTSGEQITGRIVFNIVAATGSSYFRDMGNYVWAASAVDYLHRNNVVNGIGNNSFGPNQYILRRDFILMLSRGFSFPATGTYSFPDVPMNSYYASAVASAKYLGIVRGSGGYFLPASAITREDAMVMVYNTLIKMGKNPGSGGTALLTQFSDYQSVSSYAREAVGALVQMGAVTGSNGRLNPKAPITRAEAAVILHFVLTM